MSRPVVSRRARSDLKEIFLYIARDKPDAARRLREALEGVFQLIGRNPNVGEMRPELGDGVRIFSFGNFVIIFRATQSKVVIARVIHGARERLEL